MKNKKNIYSLERWKVFSNDMLVFLGNKCFKCQRSNKETVLQIHHVAYEAGKKPWDSLPEDLEILCRGCHAREHDILEPNSDWILIDISDNGDKSFSCQRQKNKKQNCDTQIRYEHLIYHPKVGYITVGSTCIDHLTEEDRRISETLIRENSSFNKRLNAIINEVNLPKYCSIKIENHKKIMCFSIKKNIKGNNISIKADIYYNKQGKDNLSLYIEGLRVLFFNNNRNKNENYFYGEKEELKSIVFIINLIKKYKILNNKLVVEYYQKKLNSIFDKYNYERITI